MQARERELLKQNFTVPKGYRVNLRNLANPYQLEALPAGMQEALARNGFVIVPQNDIQLFHVYENNDYHNFPSFVTTDLHLQLFHMYFDFVLRQLEQEKLIPMPSTFAGSMYNHMKRQAETAPDAATRAAAEYNQTYYAVGCALLTGRPLQPVPAAYRAMAELENAKNAKFDLDDTYIIVLRALADEWREFTSSKAWEKLPENEREAKLRGKHGAAGDYGRRGSADALLSLADSYKTSGKEELPQLVDLLAHVDEETGGAGFSVGERKIGGIDTRR